jgi:hypothetical protein
MSVRYPAGMLTSVTIKCDWAGCEATLTYEPRLPFPDKHF